MEPGRLPLDGSPPEVSRWGLGDAIIGLLLAQVLALFAAGLYVEGTGAEAESVAVILISQPALWAGLAGAPVWASRRKGTGSLDQDFGLDLRAGDAKVGVPIGFLCQLLVVPLLYLPFRSLIDDRDLEGASQRIAEEASGPELALLAALFIVGAPVVEELFFRGLLLRSLERRFGGPVALVVSSATFALVHFEPWQFPALGVVGLVFGVLAQRTGRLGPGIFAHASFNSVVVALIAWDP